MRQTDAAKAALMTLVVSMAIFSASGCGKYKKTLEVSTTAPKGNKTGDPCGPEQKLGTYKAVWVYHHCASVDTVYITPESVDAKGQALGLRNVNRGMLSVKMTGLHNDNISHRENFGIFFEANGWDDREANWQYMSYNVGGGSIQSRIIVQRFDGTCPNFCEHSDFNDELQFTDPAWVFQWDCDWDTSQSRIACVVTKAGDPNLRILTMNDPLGPYNSIRYLGMGKAAFRGPYSGYPGVVSDVKMTVFE